MQNIGREFLKQLLKIINKNNQQKSKEVYRKSTTNEDYIYTETVFFSNIFILANLYSFLYKY